MLCESFGVAWHRFWLVEHFMIDDDMTRVHEAKTLFNSVAANTLEDYRRRQVR